MSLQKEVHEFQEFMKNSKNRYGGWDEYHHNIFVNMWQKHFHNEVTIDSVLSIEKAAEYNFFLRELLPKLIGISEDEIISHINWYCKYLRLKNLQQKAIDKWRSNRRKMKPSNTENKIEETLIAKNKTTSNKKCTRVSFRDDISNKAQDLLHEDNLMLESGEPQFSVRFTRKCFSDEMRQECLTNNDAINKEQHAEITKQHFLKTTKQWNIKCASENLKTENNYNNIDGIQKLGTPFWRAGL